MNVDPRVLATPIGAVIGLAIARKALRPKDRTLRNMVIGTGIGAGAGLLTGQFIRGNPLMFGKVTDDRYRRYVRNVRPKGDVPNSELRALNKLVSPGENTGSFGVTESGGGLLESWKRNFAKLPDMNNSLRQSVGQTARIQEYKRLLSGSFLGKNERGEITHALSATEALKSKHDSNIRWTGGLVGGKKATWGALKDFFASVLGRG